MPSSSTQNKTNKRSKPKNPAVPNQDLFEPSANYAAAIRKVSQEGVNWAGREEAPSHLYEPSEGYNAAIRNIHGNHQHRHSSMSSTNTSATTTSNQSSAFLQDALDHFPFEDESERYFITH